MATLTAAGPAIDSGILLEAGTNEVEILVFDVAGQPCGVNVAKVREARMLESVTFLPRFPDSVDGVVRVRGRVVPAVDLERYLWGGSSVNDESVARHLLLEFNDQLIAFRVQAIDRVYRVSWKEIVPLPTCTKQPVPVNGVILIDRKIVLLLDFETVGARLGITGSTEVTGKLSTPVTTDAAHCPLVFVDDSQLIRRMLGDALTDAGYTDAKGFSDGQEAWDYLNQVASNAAPETIRQSVAGVISDIEMPRMDGFSLTRKIRENPVLKDVPVILFSSLISKDNEKKGKQVGATAQISKPKWDELTAALTGILQQLLN